MADEQSYVIIVSRRRLATILAALAHYRSTEMYLPSKRDQFIEEIATDTGSIEPINSESELDDLSDHINFSPKREELEIKRVAE